MPNNIDSIISEFGEKGYRIIAMAYKEGGSERLAKKKFEEGLSFLGLIFFSNDLKRGTRGVLSELLKNDIKCRIITGDNIYTSINIGY